MNAREIAEAYLENCSDEELLSLLQPILAARAILSEETWAKNRLCLALASQQLSDDSSTWEPADVELVGSPDPVAYPDGIHGEPFCQHGSCPGCGARLCGKAKRTLCPACGTTAPLT